MSQSDGFDFSLLEKPLFQFVVVADSHDKLPTAAEDPEFPSRQYQHDRVTTLLELIGKLPADFLIHLGDLVQDYPETASFPESFAGAVAALKELPMPVYHVAGNHDVGDKPDPTMPTHPANAETLAAYHAACGRSWYGIEQADCVLLVVNTQIMDTGMAAEAEQRAWLEAELQRTSGKRRLLFLHLPLYLGAPDEPAIGNYDVLGRESRGWLLDLIAQHAVTLVAGAHVHFAFFDTISSTEYHQLASPSFTRPGFAHLFSAAAPPERGRDDRGKLGFYLVRVLPQAIELHFIRTEGARQREHLVPKGSQVVVFPIGGAHRRSPLGVTLREPIFREVEVPIAFPSVVRQRVRNDYPFYNLNELGAAHVRVPWSDWDNERQRRRLNQLTHRGVSLTLFSLAQEPPAVPPDHPDAGRPDALEWQLPGRTTPPAAAYDAWMRAGQANEIQTILAPVIPGRTHAGKQHPRTRIGYTADELTLINQWLRSQPGGVDRIVIDLDLTSTPRDVWVSLAQARQAGDPSWDLKLEFVSTDDDRNCLALAEALMVTLMIPGSRLLVDPLTDHDRTMDTVNGLTDTLHNPRPAFAVYRALNGILFPAQNPAGASPEFTVTPVNDSCYAVSTGDQKFGLVLDNRENDPRPASWRPTKLWDLRRGQSREWSERHPVAPPYLVTYTEA